MGTSEDDVSGILGNASLEIKRTLHGIDKFLKDRLQLDAQTHKPLFGETIGDEIQLTEVSIVPKVEEPSKMEARVVMEIVVTQGQCHICTGNMAWNSGD